MRLHLNQFVLPTITHDSVGIMRIVLGSTYKGGAYLAYTDGAFRTFTGTHWIPLSEVELGGAILQHVPPAAPKGSQRTRAMVREVIDFMKMDRATSPDQARVDDPRQIINVRNGELWIDPNGSVELHPHDPASGLRYCLDVVYDPTETCRHYDRALTEIFSNASEPTTLIAFWHEFTGYTLQPARPDARIFIGWGLGSDGRSALAGLLVNLLGRDRVAAMPVCKLASSDFMVGHLPNKALFLDDDISVGTVLPDGILKTVSEAKIITGQAKHRDPFEFQVRAVPLLLCNAVPHLRDTSHGFRRRLTVIPFERNFTHTEVDPTLFTRIYASERSGVLNRALEGLRRVAQRGWKFDPPEAVTAATEAWWRAATGVVSADAEPARHAASRSKRSRLPQMPPAVADLIVGPEITPNSKVVGTDVSADIELSKTGKSRVVHVQVGQSSVDVYVTGKPTL